MNNIDQIDIKLLRALQFNARLSMRALSEKVGLSKTPVVNRLKNLESRGVIKGYSARIDHAVLGLEHIAFVQVTLEDTRSGALKQFNDAVLLVPEVEQCHMTAAGFDYLLKVRTSDITHYRKVLGESISALPYVSNTSTFVVMETVKEPN